jgi:hypothetical protein
MRLCPGVCDATDNVGGDDVTNNRLWAAAAAGSVTTSWLATVDGACTEGCLLTRSRFGRETSPLLVTATAEHNNDDSNNADAYSIVLNVVVVRCR